MNIEMILEGFRRRKVRKETTSGTGLGYKHRQHNLIRHSGSA